MSEKVFLATANKLPNNIISALISRNFKPLETGELVLLARAISDDIPLDKNLCAKDIVLAYKYSILNIIHFINQYTFITEDQEKMLFDIIEGFIAWRLNVAYGPKEILFTSNDNFVIDEMSLITRFVDSNLLCSVGFIYNNAQFTYRLFKDIVKQFTLTDEEEKLDE